MPTAKRPPLEGEEQPDLPFTYKSVVQHIGDYLEHQPRGTQKRLAAAAGMVSQSFSHRMTEYQGQRFSIEHLAAIAKEAEAPLGWPFLSWADAAELSALRQVLARHRNHHR